MSSPFARRRTRTGHRLNSPSTYSPSPSTYAEIYAVHQLSPPRQSQSPRLQGRVNVNGGGGYVARPLVVDDGKTETEAEVETETTEADTENDAVLNNVDVGKDYYVQQSYVVDDEAQGEEGGGEKSSRDPSIYDLDLIVNSNDDDNYEEKEEEDYKVSESDTELSRVTSNNRSTTPTKSSSSVLQRVSPSRSLTSSPSRSLSTRRHQNQQLSSSTPATSTSKAKANINPESKNVYIKQYTKSIKTLSKYIRKSILYTFWGTWVENCVCDRDERIGIVFDRAFVKRSGGGSKGGGGSSGNSGVKRMRDGVNVDVNVDTVTNANVKAIENERESEKEQQTFDETNVGKYILPEDVFDDSDDASGEDSDEDNNGNYLPPNEILSNQSSNEILHLLSTPTKSKTRIKQQLAITTPSAPQTPRQLLLRHPLSPTPTPTPFGSSMKKQHQSISQPPTPLGGTYTKSLQNNNTEQAIRNNINEDERDYLINDITIQNERTGFLENEVLILRGEKNGMSNRHYDILTKLENERDEFKFKFEENQRERVGNLSRIEEVVQANYLQDVEIKRINSLLVHKNFDIKKRHDAIYDKSAQKLISSNSLRAMQVSRNDSLLLDITTLRSNFTVKQCSLDNEIERLNTVISEVEREFDLVCVKHVDERKRADCLQDDNLVLTEKMNEMVETDRVLSLKFAKANTEIKRLNDVIDISETSSTDVVSELQTRLDASIVTNEKTNDKLLKSERKLMLHREDSLLQLSNSENTLRISKTELTGLRVKCSSLQSQITSLTESYNNVSNLLSSSSSSNSDMLSRLVNEMRLSDTNTGTFAGEKVLYDNASKKREDDLKVALKREMRKVEIRDGIIEDLKASQVQVQLQGGKQASPRSRSSNYMHEHSKKLLEEDEGIRRKEAIEHEHDSSVKVNDKYPQSPCLNPKTPKTKKQQQQVENSENEIETNKLYKSFKSPGGSLRMKHEITNVVNSSSKLVKSMLDYGDEYGDVDLDVDGDDDVEYDYDYTYNPNAFNVSGVNLNSPRKRVDGGVKQPWIPNNPTTQSANSGRTVLGRPSPKSGGSSEW